VTLDSPVQCLHGAAVRQQLLGRRALVLEPRDVLGVDSIREEGSEHAALLAASVWSEHACELGNDLGHRNAPLVSATQLGGQCEQVFVLGG
jgi:hypothetical protein